MSESDKVPAGSVEAIEYSRRSLAAKLAEPDFSWAIALSEVELQALGDALSILDRLVPAPQDRGMAPASHAAFRVQLDPGKLMRIKRVLQSVVDRSWGNCSECGLQLSADHDCPCPEVRE